jgi:F-type H+-transporting ATPase subunit gamma
MDILQSIGRAEGKENLSLIVVGEIPRKRAQALGFKIDASYRLQPLDKRSEMIDELVGRLSQGFTSGAYGSAMMIYTHFVSPIDKEALVRNLLPMSALNMLAESTTTASGPDVFNTAIYDPSPSELVKVLVPEVLRQAVDYAYLHSICSEEAFRQEAMMRAADNAQEMLRDLKLSYSRLRQEDITTEMLEIASAGGMSSMNL